MDTVLELVIDYSLSMGPYKNGTISHSLPDGSTRMSLAKNALINDIVPKLDYIDHIRIITFHSKNKELVAVSHYDGPFDKNKVISVIKLLSDPIDTGGTPVSKALQASIDFLKTIENSDRKIILVTDGEENDGSDFRLTIENSVSKDKIDYNVFIVGIGQNAATAAKCKLLSEFTGGEYINLETINYDKEKLSNVLRPLTIKAVGSSIVKVQETNENLLGTVNANQDNSKKELEKNNQYNEDIIKILTGHARSIELINKQLNNLDEGSKSIDKNIASINLGMANLPSSSHLHTFEKNNLESINKMENKIDQTNTTIQHFFEGAKSEYTNQFKNVFDEIGFIKREIGNMHNLSQVVDDNTRKLLKKQNNEIRIIRTILILGFITIGFLVYLTLKNYGIKVRIKG